jgi:hypothetical protein
MNSLINLSNCKDEISRRPINQVCLEPHLALAFSLHPCMQTINKLSIKYSFLIYSLQSAPLRMAVKIYESDASGGSSSQLCQDRCASLKRHITLCIPVYPSYCLESQTTALSFSLDRMVHIALFHPGFPPVPYHTIP